MIKISVVLTTKNEEKNFKEAMKTAGIKDCLMFLNTHKGEVFTFQHGDLELMKRIIAGLAQKHEVIMEILLEILRISAGAKYLNISIDKEPPPPEGKA